MQPNFETEHAQLSAGQALGLSNRGSENWHRLTALQYSNIEKGRALRIISYVVGALACLPAYLSFYGQNMVVGWLALLVAFIAFAFVATRNISSKGRSGRVQIAPEAFIKHNLVLAAVSLVWVIPIAGLAFVDGHIHTMPIWVVTAGMIACWSLLTPSLPLSTIVFTTLSCLSGIIAGIGIGTPMVVVCIGLYAAIAIIGTIEHAKNFLNARIAIAGDSEKNEVVSLLLREFEENQADWLWHVDTSRRVRSVSPRFAYALNKAPEEVEGLPFLQLIAGQSWQSGQLVPSLHDLADHMKRKQNFSNLVVRVTISGENRWWELSGTPIIDEDGDYQGFRGVGSDVTEQRESDDKIAYLARYDTLTGLPNRLMLNETLRHALAQSDKWSKRCALLMLDLDRFKAVNDSLGHLVGDKLLAQVADRLSKLTDENCLCGRLGGDEFAIVIRDATNPELVEKLAHHIIMRLSQPFEISNHTLYVGASLGSAVGPRDGHTVEEIMRNADLARYQAKDKGGGEHCSYEPSLHRIAEERRKMEYSLRHAMERNEMSLNYQPIVDAQSEQVVGFEALIRWNNDEHGQVSPEKFIPLAEETRLIVPIGNWVLQQACREAMHWPANMRVSVNISGEQLIHPEFVTTVVSALTNSGLDANRLELEVTESIFLRDGELAKANIEQVIALGCSVALDDFGTGYSSLGYLRNLRLSNIKIDRSFVQGAAVDNEECLAIIRAVIAMAQSLNISTTAEGVEGPEQADMMRNLGCQKIQGYFYGRPMQAQDVLQAFAVQQQEQDRRSA